MLALLSLLAQSSKPALAFRLPIGAVASQQKLTEKPGSLSRDTGKYNLSYVPLLLELAKVLGRYQHGYGFFLRNEPFSHHPGIDLRWLLFNQSSPLSIDGLKEPTRGLVPVPADGPTLLVPAIGGQSEAAADSTKTPLVSLLAVRPLPADANSYPLDESRARVGSPDQVSVALKGNELKDQPPVLMIDFRGLSAALKGIGDPGAQIIQTAWRAPTVRSTLTPPLPVSKSEKTVHTGFLLWTLKPATTGGIIPDRPAGWKSDAPSGLNSNYAGTFVALAPGARFRSLRPRHLTIQQGRVLAGNRGEEMIFETGLGELHLETGASALVDLSDKGVLRVIALESDDNAGVTLVTKKPDGGNEVISLAPGEEVVLSNHELSNQEILVADGVTRNITSYGGKVARTRVSVAELLGKERLLDPGSTELTECQRSALAKLRETLENK